MTDEERQKQKEYQKEYRKKKKLYKLENKRKIKKINAIKIQLK